MYCNDVYPPPRRFAATLTGVPQVETPPLVVRST
jgi:hypothetical protein